MLRSRGQEVDEPVEGLICSWNGMKESLGDVGTKYKYIYIFLKEYTMVELSCRGIVAKNM